MSKPEEKDLLDNLGKIAFSLDKAYVSRLSSDYGVLYFDEKYNKEEIISFENNIRAVKVDRWVFDKEEKPGENFKNVLSTFADGDHSIALVVKRTPTNTEMYFVVKNEGAGRNEDSGGDVSLLESSIKGNFQGTDCKILDVNETKEMFSYSDRIKVDGKERDAVTSIALLTNTPSEYSEDYIGQGLEKVLNGAVPQTKEDSYTIVFLAESLSMAGIREIISGYEEMATAITPLMQYQFQSGINEMQTHGEMESISDTKAISNTVFKTHSIHAGLSVSHQSGNMSSGVSAGYGYSWGKSKTVTNSQTKTRGTSSSISRGTSESTTYTYKSYLVSDLVTKLEETINRINKSQAAGLWKYSAYVLAGNSKTTKNVTNFLKGITQGKASYNEPAYVQEWSKQEGNGLSAFNEIKKYISHFTHPVFVAAGENNEDFMLLTPTSYIATDELSHVIAFPQKSLQGLPVLEGVEFGREPHSLIETDSDIELGAGYHMHHKLKQQRIKLSKEELTKHTFITGSTGSGKSNTIYRLLENLNQENVRFLVVEPAKGEYRMVFGNRKNVCVYGTNPNISDYMMLRLNPFSFPKSIHILEHLDRLVEIFNVCWPMYAAMPAILKEAVENSYIAAGWDLTLSKNKYDENLYPSFNDLLTQIKKVLEKSDYSNDNKGDYTGALVTRIRSLTNGINGLIFTTDDVKDEELFDINAIVDLSRVGSAETKALIMGLLVLKLQEYRMDAGRSNSKLRHITVLEEAHNLLKKTSTEQVSEGANLLGKSVEMLANSIAEMRTYGEGFIIADQSPGLLDLSVIRNTNTKIILRLPDYSDRELVGRAAGLNENQIIELGRLEKGVASITQSDWIEPVLCKIDKFDEKCDWKTDGIKKPRDWETNGGDTGKDAETSLLECIMSKEIYRRGDRVDIQKLKTAILKSKLDIEVKCDFMDYISVRKEGAVRSLQKLVYDFFGADHAIEASKGCRDISDWVHSVVDQLSPEIMSYTRRQIDLVMELIIYEQSLRDATYNNLFCRFSEIYKMEGGVF